ncbi:MAG: LysR family transcriptional regulator [Polyangiales bacterium]
MNWEDLKYVLAMARHENATAAGKALRVNATTVTRRIHALEASLEVTLFDRSSSGMLPTEAGTSAVAAAERMEQEVLQLDATVHGLDDAVQGALRVASLDMVFDLWQADFAEFRKRHPRMRLALTASARSADLLRREADVALRLTVMPPEQLVGRRLTEVFYAVYASTDLIQEMKSEAAPEYAAYPWIGWDEPYSEPTDRVIDRVAKGAQVVLRINTMHRLRQSMERGEGVSVLPCFMGDSSAKLQRLGSYFEGGTYLWALTHEQLRRTGRIRAFMDFVAELIERDEDLIHGRRPRLPTIVA